MDNLTLKVLNLFKAVEVARPEPAQLQILAALNSRLSFALSKELNEEIRSLIQENIEAINEMVKLARDKVKERSDAPVVRSTTALNSPIQIPGSIPQSTADWLQNVIREEIQSAKKEILDANQAYFNTVQQMYIAQAYNPNSGDYWKEGYCSSFH